MPMKVKSTKHIKDLTDDVLCALVARNEVRKLGLNMSTGSTHFSTVFHDYSDFRKSSSEKQAAKLERERRKKLLLYVAEHLTVKDELGELTEHVVTE
jgi:hypothetical protein